MKVIMHKAATKNCGYLFEVEQNLRWELNHMELSEIIFIT